MNIRSLKLVGALCAILASVNVFATAPPVTALVQDGIGDTVDHSPVVAVIEHEATGLSLINCHEVNIAAVGVEAIPLEITASCVGVSNGASNFNFGERIPHPAAIGVKAIPLAATTAVDVFVVHNNATARYVEKLDALGVKAIPLNLAKFVLPEAEPVSQAALAALPDRAGKEVILI